MRWDEEWAKRDQRLVTRQRVLNSSPDHAYGALESYGSFVTKSGSHIGWDDEMEAALAARNHPLINIALGKYAASAQVLADLYGRSMQGTGDPDQDKAVRLACLSNRVAFAMLRGFHDDVPPAIGPAELRRIAHEGDDDEVTILFSNPTCRGLVRDLYDGKPPFDDLARGRRLLLVHCTANNDGINRDDSDEHGPDLTSWNLHRALFELVRTAPVDVSWIRALHPLLMHLNPAHTRSPENVETATEAVNRWKGLYVPRTYKPEEGEEEGYYTQLSLVEELRCLVAALYGRVYATKKFEFIGTLESDDVALRCVAYARTKLSVEQMQKANARDQAAFVLTALFNDELLLDRVTRVALESMVRWDLEFLYKRRCAQLKERYDWFDPTPISDDFQEEAPPQVALADAASVRAIASDVGTLQKSIGSLSKTLYWGLIILGALFLWRH